MEDDFNEYDDNLKSEDIDDDQYTYFDEADAKEDNYDVDYDYFNDYHNYDADDTIYRNEINYTNDTYDDEKDEEHEEKSFRSKLLKPIVAILVIIVILCIITICTSKLNKPKKSSVKETDVDDTGKYLYEYVKEEKKSSWSTWTNEIETSCDTKTITCNDDTCNKEVEVTKKNVQLASENKIYTSSRSAFKTNGKEIKQVCRNYDYIKINGIYYRTESNSGFKDIGLIKKTTQSNYNNWIYRGRSSFKNPPNDTLTVRYVFVEADYSKCGDTCSDGPNYYYDMYTFRYSLSYSANPQSDCNNLIQKGIPDYSINPQQISVARLEKKYTTVCYKKERTKITSTDVKENKWSTYNDENLLNSGYIYSGNKKEK